MSGNRAEGLTVQHRVDPDRRVVAITGASGFLGSELLQRFEKDRRYRQVIALDLAEPRPRLSKTAHHRVDLTQPGADADMATILERYRVDTVVHLAFLSRPTHNATWAHELEVIGTLNVLNACAARALHKLVCWSQTSLFGAHKANPTLLTDDEKMRGVPGSRFFTDKLEAERLARRFARENPATVVTILRTANILGRRVGNFFSRYLGHPVVPTLMGYDPLFQLIGEDDAVDAFKLCVDADFQGRFNIAAPGVLPLGTIVALTGRLSLPIPSPLVGPIAAMLWAAQLRETPPRFAEFLRHSCVVDTRPSEKELSYRPKKDIRQVVLEFAEGLEYAQGQGAGQ